MWHPLQEQTYRRLAVEESVFDLPDQRLASMAIARHATNSADCGVATCLIGTTGSGKSTLTRQLAREVFRQDTRSKALLLSLAEIQQLFRQAHERQSVGELFESFYQANLLICEDLDRGSGWDDVPELQAYFWDTLMDRGVDVIWTSRRFPGTIPEIPARLANRCHAAWSIVLPPFSLAAREVFTKGFCQQLGSLPSGVALQYIVNRPSQSPGELKGWLWSVVQRYGTVPRLWSFEQLAVLDRDSQSTGPSFLQIVNTVADQFHVRLDDLLSHSRKREYLLARHCAMYLCKEVTKAPLTHIASFFGGRDHTTISHGCHRIQQAIHKEPALRQLVRTLQQHLSRNPQDECA